LIKYSKARSIDEQKFSNDLSKAFLTITLVSGALNWASMLKISLFNSLKVKRIKSPIRSYNTRGYTLAFGEDWISSLFELGEQSLDTLHGSIMVRLRSAVLVDFEVSPDDIPEFLDPVQSDEFHRESEVAPDELENSTTAQ
jgi:hypothetical protein